MSNENEGDAKFWFSAISALLGLIVGALITGIANWYTAKETAQKELEISLINTAMQADQPFVRAEAINFFTHLGLIKTKSIVSGVETYLDNPESYRIPSLKFHPDIAKEIRIPMMSGGNYRDDRWEFAFWVEETFDARDIGTSAVYVVASCSNIEPQNTNPSCRFLSFAYCPKPRQNNEITDCISNAGQGKMGFSQPDSRTTLSMRVDFNLLVPIDKQKETIRVWRMPKQQ